MSIADQLEQHGEIVSGCRYSLPMPPTRELLDIMADQMTVGDGCWQWKSLRSGDGYGRVRHQKKDQLAHRVVYELLVGPIPEGLTLDHLCRNRGCVRPAHLEPVTLAENTRRGQGMSARNARKTHCLNGHALTSENLDFRRSNRREYQERRRNLNRR